MRECRIYPLGPDHGIYVASSVRYPAYIPTTFTPLLSLIVSFHPHPIITTATAGGEQRDSRSGYHLPRVRLLSSTVTTITIPAVEQSRYKDS
jgi:hypothetical protein